MSFADSTGVAKPGWDTTMRQEILDSGWGFVWQGSSVEAPVNAGSCVAARDFLVRAPRPAERRAEPLSRSIRRSTPQPCSDGILCCIVGAPLRRRMHPRGTCCEVCFRGDEGSTAECPVGGMEQAAGAGEGGECFRRQRSGAGREPYSPGQTRVPDRTAGLCAAPSEAGFPLAKAAPSGHRLESLSDSRPARQCPRRATEPVSADGAVRQRLQLRESQQRHQITCTLRGRRGAISGHPDHFTQTRFLGHG